ncbi:uncharacterized protein [Coffea arabica]|uniref:Uncharacterized protein LOC113742600 n=1 Tax=Coffea arabica TaxID=13443 RepID=A0A6P6XH42_COFAR|nr:uncharacterized protein LOC113742600 [Coffea arabica]XP_027126276.1 uncharacterized protein LOC113742600 [Coffea arabica]
MALNTNQILYNTPARTPCTNGPLRRTILLPPLSSPRTHHLTVVSASKKLSSSRTGKFDSKKRRSSVSTTEEAEEAPKLKELDRTADIDGSGSTVTVDDGFVMPELPGEKPDFWEGPQWDTLGFVIQYLWAFGIVFALIACGIAVATYNEGATDFKDTPAYKESIQSRELLEEPEASGSDVFESNPTEEAPSLE